MVSSTSSSASPSLSGLCEMRGAGCGHCQRVKCGKSCEHSLCNLHTRVTNTPRTSTAVHTLH